ncbi:hypothetical protein GQ457_18G010550 [Hibiscus cannabinus]
MITSSDTCMRMVKLHILDKKLKLFDASNKAQINACIGGPKRCILDKKMKLFVKSEKSANLRRLFGWDPELTEDIGAKIHDNHDTWSDVVTLWKATHMKPNGTWFVPNGEEILNKLREEGEKNQEKISSAHIPIVEHFALVLGTTSNYSRGIGVGGITSSSHVKSCILAETIAAKNVQKVKLQDLLKLQKSKTKPTFNFKMI